MYSEVGIFVELLYGKKKIWIFKAHCKKKIIQFL